MNYLFKEEIHVRFGVFLVGGRGKVSHKGRRRHFTDEEDLKHDLEKAKREQEWRVSGVLRIFSYLMGFVQSTSALLCISECENIIISPRF